jgi:histidinol phosphatase-like PHP family hydrolase
MPNGRIAELLARLGKEADDRNRAKAYERASHAALVWKEEAGEVVGRGESLTRYPGIGKSLSARIESWLQDPPQPEDTPEDLTEFLSMTEAVDVLNEAPGWREGIRGDLQMHTTYSDGADTLFDMADALSIRAYEFAAITDHSSGLRIANGLSDDELIEQGRVISSLNDVLEEQGSTLELLRAVEMNLDIEGRGDVDEGVLQDLDIVLGSFHSGLRTIEDRTERYLGALDNPWVDVLAHPRGRRFGMRPGLRADWDTIFETAAERRTAIEINSSVLRQDLQLSLLKKAADYDVLLTIGTDSHSVGELAFMEYGLAALVLAGIPRERVVNFWGIDEVREWVRSRRDSAL